MSIRDDFFAAKAKGALWDVAVSIKRGNPLPLDANSIFESYSALEAYAADVLAYPGQVVSVVNADSTTIYYLDQNKAIQPVGIIPSGDSKTIEVTEAGAISLLGAANAANGTIPMLDSETGKLTWKTLEDIGAGDGNDNTTYEFSFANEKIVVTPKHNGVAQTAVELDLSNFITADELTTELNKLVDNDTTYSIAEDEKVLKLNDTVFSTEIGLKHENGKISLTGINGAVIAEFSDADFVKDSVLEDVAYNSETQEIVFTWKTLNGETKTDAVSVADFVQTYTAGHGLELASNEFAVKIDSESEAFLSVGANGVKLSGIQEAINTAAGNAKTEAINDAAGKYATTGALSQLETDLDTRLDVLEAYEHNTYATKNELKATDDVAKDAQNRVDIVEGKIDEITSVGGEPNVIEKIKVNGVTLEVEKDSENKSTKTVNISVPTTIAGLSDWATVNERITTAKTQADKGVDDASAANALATANKEKIDEYELAIQLLNESKTTYGARITTLENANSEHNAQYTSLKNTVDGHTSTLAGKADQSTVDAVSQKASVNEQAIKTLNETTIPTLNTEVGKKANSDDVYTKTQIGSIDEGKTLVEMIAAAKDEASYDDTELRNLIGNPAAEGTVATGLHKSLADEVARATAAEQAFAIKLENVGTVMDFVGVITDENLPSTEGYQKGDVIIHKAQEYVFDGSDWQPFGDASINAALISALDARVGANENAITLINDSSNGILVQAKTYTDNAIKNLPKATVDALGLIKVDNETIEVDAEGTIAVKEVSTDKLTQGEDELVLMGGDASSN